jgi:PPM family protein phosphatase
MALSWQFGAFSDIGRTRKKNDDSGYAGPHLIVVADGMGGAAAGDLASAIAVETLKRLDTSPTDDLLETLAGTLHRANDRLAELVDQDPSVAGMGTTVTAALFDGQRIGVAHLGDSRAYLWRKGELLRLTTDHTWVQSLIDEGRITEDEAKVHSHRSLLLKVLDGQHDHDPDLAVYEVEAGDRVLLCSDGLSGFVDGSRIERALSVGTADSVARELTQLALEAGSTDNITVIVADVVDSEAGITEPIVVGAVAAPPRKALSRLRTWAQRDEAVAGKSLMSDSDVDAEELRYAPRAPRRFSGLRRLAVLLVCAVVLAAGGLAAYEWSQQQYYVGAYGERVAIYRGVQADLPGLNLHSVYQSQDLRLSELPSFRRSQVVEGLTAGSFASAQRIVANLRTFARVCAEQAAASASATGATTAASTTTVTTGPARPTSTTATRRHPAPTTPAHAKTSSPPASPRTRSARSPSRIQATAQPRAAQSAAGPPAPEECAGATPATLRTGTPK